MSPLSQIRSLSALYSCKHLMFLFETSFLQDYSFLECEAVQSGKYILALLITQRRIKGNPDLVKRKELLLP
jgi:hypothetical protein